MNRLARLEQALLDVSLHQQGAEGRLAGQIVHGHPELVAKARAIAELLARSRHYASGSSRPADIVALNRAGQALGVVGQGLSREAERELERVRVPVFVDSGAFTAPVSDWSAVLATYTRLGRVLGRRLAVVAPDVVGDAPASRKLLQQHQAELRRLVEQGVAVVVPAQREIGGLIDGWRHAVEALGPRVWVGVPSNKAAATDEEIEALIRAGARRLHFLGLGVTSARGARLVADLLLRHGLVEVSFDSSIRRALVGGGGALSRAEKEARELVEQGTYSGAPDAPDYTDEIGTPSAWLTARERERVAKAVQLSPQDAMAFRRDPDAVVARCADDEAGAWWCMELEAALDEAWRRFYQRASVPAVRSAAWERVLTPGTRIGWSSVREWVNAFRAIHARKIRSRRYTDEASHLVALAECPVEFFRSASSSDLAELDQVVRQVQPPRGQREGHPTTRLLDLIDRARHARN